MLKKALRPLFKSKRNALSQEDITLLSEQINQQLLHFLKGISFTSINVFLSSESKKEIQTKQLISALWEIGKEVNVPVSNYKDASMEAWFFTPKTGVTLDQYNIPTPSSGNVITPNSIDIVITPLLCADKKGYRVGYGKGMYDRFFSRCSKNVLKIGVSMFDFVDKIHDTDQYDYPLDVVIFPNKIVKIKNN